MNDSTKHGHDNSPPTGRGLADAATMLVAVAPLGVALGATASDAGVHPLISWLTAPLIVAGAAQLVLLTQLDSGATAVAAASAAILVNARFMVYGAALAVRFRNQPTWFRVIAPHYVVDQTYGLVTTRVAPEVPDPWFRHYFAAAGTLLWVGWAASFGTGVLVGAVLPPGLWLEMVLPVTFAALVAPQLRRPSEFFAAAGGGIAVLAGLPTTLALGVGAVVAAGAGATSHRGSR